MSLYLSGVATGFDSISLVDQLVQVERIPQRLLQNRRKDLQAKLAFYREMVTAAGDLRTSSRDLVDPYRWNKMAATSSDSSVNVRASDGAAATSLTVRVHSLARAGSAMSAGSVAGLAAPAVSSPTFALAVGAAGTGITGVDDSGAGPGAHTVDVVQASTAAQRTGTAVGETITFAGPNANQRSVTFNVNGTDHTVTFAAGTYTREQAAQVIRDQTGGVMNVAVTDAGEFSFTSINEGSANTIQVVGGAGMDELGLTADAAATAGTDGIVSVNGTQTVLTDIAAGSTQTLAGGLTIATSGIRGAGTSFAVHVASSGDRTLSTVVDQINSLGTAVTASAVSDGAGGFKLQIASTVTGAGTGIIGGDAFSPLGGLNSVAGSDARVQIGTSDTYLTSKTNTITGISPGVSIDVTAADPAKDVVIDIARDVEGLADRAKSFVDKLNDLLGKISSKTKYDDGTKNPLAGDRMLRALASRIRGEIVTQFGSIAGAAGIGVDRSGKVTFDRAEFVDAMAKDPAAVRDVFAHAGTATSPGVRLLTAGGGAQVGTYAVNITEHAARAEVRTASLAGETITVDLNGTAVEVTAEAGATLEQIAAQLNDGFESSGIAAVAFIDAGEIVFRSESYGSNQTLTVTSSAGTNVTATGVDVAGTIDGRAATGAGQALTAAAGDPTVPGLSLRISATAAATFDFTYQPGVAARVSHQLSVATDPLGGELSLAVDAGDRDTRRLDDQISSWDKRIDSYRERLRRKFSAMETALARLQDQQAYLLANLPPVPSANKN